MPKITREDLENIDYISMVDFSYRVDQIVDFQEKVDFATKYLMAYGKDGGERDYTFEEATHIVRMKIGEESLRLKSKLPDSSKSRIKDNPHIVNPNLMYDKDDLGNQMFFGNPSLYLTGSDSDEVLGDHLYGNFNEKIANIEKNSNSLDIRFRMEKNMGKELFEDTYKATKPGFFSKMFNTSSREYQNLNTVYNAFNNPNHALYGNLNSLEKATNEYLMHKFPNWRPSMPIPDDVYAKLDKTEAARVRFCVGVKDAVKEQREKTEGYKEMVDACANQKIRFADIDRPFMQNIFRDQIKNDIANDEVSNNDIEIKENSNEIKNEISNENENDIQMNND